MSRSLILPVPQSNWIPRECHRQVAELLVDNNLCKMDNSRRLPLTGGGTTDLYVDLRRGRSNPAANIELANLYGHAIRWLDVDRILEVPEAISGVAALLSSITGIPYATIRKDAKEGRSRIVGEVKEGERVVIIDDVITDGGSKIPALELCRELKLNLVALVVLVDRQQGWRAKLVSHRFAVPVWAGMTLHDFRREVIAMGVMQRCDPEVEAKNPIIVALDGKPREQAFAIAEQLRTTGCVLKVNDLIKAEGIDHLLPELKPYGRIMVDLKEHDIPNTVNNDCERLSPHSPWAVTVHASGDGEMIKAARQGLGASSHTNILAVTVLTSLDPRRCKAIYGRTPREQVTRLANIAMDAGADGLVCSAHEVHLLSNMFARSVRLVVPGVRSPGTGPQDQKRVDTPATAVKHGAHHVVMGRQILNAPDPVAEVGRVLAAELRIQ